MNALLMPFNRRPVSRCFQGRLVDRGLHLVMHVGAGLHMKEENPQGLPVFLLCLQETGVTVTWGLDGICGVFVEGVGHGNIVCYPKEHIILRFRKKFTGFIVMS